MKNTSIALTLALVCACVANAQEENFVDGGLAPVESETIAIQEVESILKVVNEVEEPIATEESPTPLTVTRGAVPSVPQDSIEFAEELNPTSGIPLAPEPIAVDSQGHITLPTELNRIAPAPMYRMVPLNPFATQSAYNPGIPPQVVIRPVVVRPVVVRPVPVNRYVGIRAIPQVLPVQRAQSIPAWAYQVQPQQLQQPCYQPQQPAFGSRLMRLFR